MGPSPLLAGREDPRQPSQPLISGHVILGREGGGGGVLHRRETGGEKPRKYAKMDLHCNSFVWSDAQGGGVCHTKPLFEKYTRHTGMFLDGQ